MALKSGLYVVATPIGNLGDMSFRAVEVLKKAELILCEDTRVTGKLCAAYEIKTQKLAYHDHNAEAVRPKILEQLSQGGMIALVSDAGTPLISDPGFKLVCAVRDEGFDVFTVPGPSAVTAALSISSAPTDAFTFGGFLPNKTEARAKHLKRFLSHDCTLVFFDSATRLTASLRAIAEVYGERQVSVARELTKLFEEVVEGSSSDLIAKFEAAKPKGEIVIVIHAPKPTLATDADIIGLLRTSLEKMSVKDAADHAAETLSVPRKIAYQHALDIKRGGDGA